GYIVVANGLLATATSDVSKTAVAAEPVALAATFTNVYTQKTGNVEVTKVFDGITGTDIPSGFKITNDYNTDEFTVSNATSGTGTTASPYKWTIENVPVGTKVKFTESGYAKDGYTVTINSKEATAANAEIESAEVNETSAVTVEYVNTYKQTSVKISKVDITNEKELPGAHIVIIDSKGTVVTEWDSTDQPKEIKGLKTEEKYTLRETVAPDGYQLTTDTTFTLDKDGNVDTSNTTTTQNKDGVLLVEDWPQGSIVLNKRCLYYELSSAKSAATRPLEGVEFTIRKQNDTSFTARTAMSNENGIVTFTKLDAGTYEISETKAPVDYIIDNRTFYAKIDAKGNYSGLVDFAGKAIEGNIIVNEPKRADIELAKVNKDDKTEKLPGSQYGLYVDSSEIMRRDPGITPTEDGYVLVATATTDSEGKIEFKGFLTNVEYVIRELESPDGFYVSEEAVKISFDVDENGNVKVKSFDNGKGTAIVDSNGNITWLEPEVVVSFTKADPKGNILAGAKLRVLDENGKELLSWTSGAEPYVVKGKLIAGKSYTLVEDEAPSGYEKAAPIGFTVAEKAGANGAETIKITMTDKPKESGKTDTNVNKTTTPKKTGDSAPLMLIIGLMLLSLIAIVITVLMRKRNKER
ncbi:MAG: hypothetical protein IJ619_09390, partial [Eubacterium sp.]|nr:hypothetical protein [Eubacterium sp.]